MKPSEISHATARVPQEVYQAALDRALKAEMENARLRSALAEIAALEDDCCSTVAEDAFEAGRIARQALSQ